MSKIEGYIFCNNCGVEITWGTFIPPARLEKEVPLTARKPDYCCRDCFEGIPCRCGERMELDQERRKDNAPTLLTR